MGTNVSSRVFLVGFICCGLIAINGCRNREAKETLSVAANEPSGGIAPAGNQIFIEPAKANEASPVEIRPVAEKAKEDSGAKNKDEVLPLIDIARDTVEGEWRFRKGTLVAPDSANARIMLPCAVPPQYRVRMIVERLAGTNGCGIGMVAGGRQLVAHCDSPYKNKRTTGLALVGGEREYENETAYEGLLLRTHHPVEIIANVTHSGVTVTIAGKEIIRFMNGYHRIQIPEELVVPDKGKLFLFADRCPCLIESVEVTALTEDVNLSAPPVKSASRPAPSTSPPRATPTPSASPSTEAAPEPTPSAFPGSASPSAPLPNPLPSPAPSTAPDSSSIPPAASPSPAVPRASPNSALRTEKVDDHGRLPTTTVRLDDFVDVAVDEFGDQYEAYEFLPPVVANDWEDVDLSKPGKGRFPTDPRLETVLDQANARKGNFQLGHVFAMDIDPAGKTLFWTNRTEHTQHGGTSYRAALDHSDSRLLAKDLELSMGMTVDHENKRAYVTMREKDLAKGWTVRRVDFEGLHNGKALTGFSGLRALAVDPKRGFLYTCDDKNRIFQSDLDGGGAKVLAPKAGGLDLAFDANRQKLYYSYQGWSLSVCDATSGEVANIFGDELYRTERYLWHLEDINGLSLDPSGTTLFFRLGGTEIFRCGVDGSRIQQLVCGSHSRDHVVLADHKGEYLYFPEMSPDLGTRIRRIPIPPPPAIVVKPAPPLVTGYQPARGKTGDVISIQGEFFQDIQEVAMIGLSTGDYMKVKYEVVSPEQINATVPALPHVCDRLAVVVLGSSGVTVTMPFDSLTIDKQRHRAIGAALSFDSYAKNQRYTVVANQKTSVTQLGRAIAYGSWDSYLSTGTEGRCAFFVKNHATTSCLNFHDGIIFHEPFAIIHARHKLEQDSRIVPVSAIRPSFVNSLFEFDRGSATP
jgi:hypothetical protein